MNAPDPRLNPTRPDLAADYLRGRVAAERFVAGLPMRINIEICDLLAKPRIDAARETQALYGETVSVFEQANGWGWIQLQTDRYVGYVRAEHLAPADPTPTHCVRVPRTLVYAEASIKTPVVRALPMGATLTCGAAHATFLSCSDGFVVAAHLVESRVFERDFVTVAESFLNAPYLWGGKSWLGIDCSGLVQLALSRAGVAAPRDTDMLEKQVGASIVAGAAAGALRRGDLVFWKGHVGVMQDATRLLHANGHHMMTVSEPFESARARILESGAGDVTSIRRLS